MKPSGQSILNLTDVNLLPQRSGKCRLELALVTAGTDLQAWHVGWADDELCSWAGGSKELGSGWFAPHFVPVYLDELRFVSYLLRSGGRCRSTLTE